MTDVFGLPSPRQTFDDNMRPTQLLLSVYRLLDSNDQILSEGEKMMALRKVVEASEEEDLMLFYNEIFMGLVREGAQLPRSQLKRAALSNLLRQAVVVGCTALETYLPAIVRTNLPLVIKTRKRESVPRNDSDLAMQFKTLTFSLDEALRIMADPNPEEFISGKMLGLINFSYLTGHRGVAVAGKLLGIVDPWRSITERLLGEKGEALDDATIVEEATRLQKSLRQTVERRNDVVHRADRPQSDPGGRQQAIQYAWAKHAVNTVEDVCHALDELVTEQMTEIRAGMEEDGLGIG